MSDIDGLGRIRRRIFAQAHEPRFVRYAGFLSRLLAMVIDLLIIGTTWVLGGLAFSFIRRTSGVDELLALLGGALNWLVTFDQALVGIVVEVSSLLLLSQIYFTFFYSFGGATVGKALLGLRVVRRDGRPLRVPQAVWRTLAYGLSTLLLYVGFLYVLVDDRRRGLHDIVSGTVVVHSWKR
jgi:uncharacterized RDD family membrane protein YckC